MPKIDSIDINENRDYSKEEWRLIQNPMVRGVYSISNMGRVRNEKNGKILKPHLATTGYLNISLPHKLLVGKNRTIGIHTLVLNAFSDEKEKCNNKKFIVNHKDGIKHHSYLSNLEWVSYSENYEHARKIGLCWTHSTENHYLAKHTEDLVREICYLLVKDYSYAEIIEELDLPDEPKTIKFLTKIACRKQWRNISDKYNFKTHTKESMLKYDKQYVTKLYMLIKQGYTLKELCEIEKIKKEDYNKFRNLIYKLRKKLVYKDLTDKLDKDYDSSTTRERLPDGRTE